MKLIKWLFTREERKFLPEMLTTILFAMGISWVVCSYMLHQRELLWDSVLYQAQEIDFDMYEVISALHIEILDTQIQLMEMEIIIDDLQHPWQDLELEEPTLELPGLYIMENHNKVCKAYQNP